MIPKRRSSVIDKRTRGPRGPYNKPLNKRGPRGPCKVKPFKPLGDHPLPDKLDAIRNKYKYGVPNTVVEVFADEILTGLEVIK